MNRDFNFFSIYVDKKQKSRRKKMIQLTSISAIILVFIIFFGINQYRIISLEEKVNELEKVVNSKERLEAIAKYNTTKKKIDLLNEYYAALTEINKKIININTINSSLLRNIEATLPGDVFITGMSATTSLLNIQGVSVNKQAIAEFQHNLKNINTIEGVHVNIINKESDESNNYIFALQCTLGDVIANEDD